MDYERQKLIRDSSPAKNAFPISAPIIPCVRVSIGPERCNVAFVGILGAVELVLRCYAHMAKNVTHELQVRLFLTSHSAKVSLVPVPRRNPDTSYCEVRKSVRDSLGVARTIEVVTIVKGVARAQAAVDELTKQLTEDQRKSGAFFCWEYTSRRIIREK
jgi:hypothetical protein